MTLTDNMRTFPISVYGQLEKYNNVLSKARCRMFYKGANRNGTFITDEFADKLISTLNYTPIKGIFDSDKQDYCGHGAENAEGRIYGVTPVDLNFAWEKNLDEDGIEREYACIDVLLYTSLYEEAKLIPQKSQSMELYPPSISGVWKIYEGQKVFEYTDACFYGLQVLGDDVEPCFEGAAFYELCDKYTSLYNQQEGKVKTGGQKNMKDIFRLGDNEKHRKLFELLNPNFNEENGWVLDYDLIEVYDDYALTKDYDTHGYARVYYSVNPDTEEVTLKETTVCYMVDVTQQEMASLETIKALNNHSYESLDENFMLVSEHQEKIQSEEQKNLELTEQYSTLQTEIEENKTKYEEMSSKVDTLESENNSLKEYQVQAENEKKLAVIDKYSNQLAQESVDQYKEKMSEYSVLDLEKEILFDLAKNNPTLFSASNNNFNPIDVNNDPQKDVSEVGRYIESHKKK